MFEIEAAHVLGSKFTNSFIKTVKFRTTPSPNELIKQLNLVLVQLEYIMNTPKNLTVRLMKQKNQNEPKLAVGECDEATLASAQMMQAYNTTKWHINLMASLDDDWSAHLNHTETIITPTKPFFAS